jgi:hypothetical protein
MYSTVPAVALPGLFNTWLITDPEPAVAPLIPPVMAPIVQLYVLPALEVSVMFVLVPVQIDVDGAFVTTGFGLTVTVIVYGAPTQFPVDDVGVIIYLTVPAVLLPGLVSVWLIKLPAPELAPVIPPVIVPTVHVKLLGVLAVSEIFGLVPVHIDIAAGLVTTGVGLTVTVIV